MMAHEFEIKKDYDLVLLLNVIMFMKKEFVLNKLLPSIGEHMRNGGKLILSFFLEDDDIMVRGKRLSQYTVEEICSALPGLELIQSVDAKKNEDHPPVGLHVHHVQNMMFARK